MVIGCDFFSFFISQNHLNKKKKKKKSKNNRTNNRMTVDNIVGKSEPVYAAVPLEVMSAIPSTFVPAASGPSSNVVFVDSSKPLFTTPSKRCLPTALIFLVAFLIAEVFVVYTVPIYSIFSATFQLTLVGVLMAVLLLIPRRLEVYNDRLVVRYGPCFYHTTAFKDIVHVEHIKFAPFTLAVKFTTSFRNMVLVHRKGCFDLLVTPEDLDQFLSVLRQHALSGSYNA